MLNILKEIVMSVHGYLKADWQVLLIGTLIAVSLNVYVDSEKLKKALAKNSKLSIPGAVLFGALTPLCACGTMAVLVSMFVTAMPWGSVMAFLISSPLSSPSEYMFETAFFGSRFATGMLISSIALGLIAGFTAHILEMKTGFFKGQFRLDKSEEKVGCCKKDSVIVEEKGNSFSKIEKVKISKASISSLKVMKVEKCSCSPEISATVEKESLIIKYRFDKFAKQIYEIGVKKILFYFVIFIAIGTVVEMILPKQYIMSLFSGEKTYSIPLAATIGLPLYVNGSSALPLLKVFTNAGASEGAIMAFLIAGKATGIPVMTGMASFIRKKSLLYYVCFVYFGAILCGYMYQYISNLIF